MEIGLPPHAYQMQLRVMRSRALLARGQRRILTPRFLQGAAGLALFETWEFPFRETSLVTVRC